VRVVGKTGTTKNNSCVH